MPKFAYRAYDQAGVLKSGEIVCESRDAALHALARRGELPVEVSEGGLVKRERWWQRELVGTGRLSTSGLAIISRELATMLKADIPIDEAIRVISLQPSIPSRLRGITRAILSDIVAGYALSEALLRQGNAFPTLFTKIVEAGEVSGTLAEVFDDLAGFYERSAEMRAKVASALLYPIVLLIAALSALAVILVVLLPTVVHLFEEAGAELPAALAALFAIQEGILRHWVAVCAIGGGVAIAATVIIGSDPIRASTDSLLMRVPLIGSAIQKSQTARFARTLATLSRNGVPLPNALQMTSAVLGNRAFRLAVRQAGDDLLTGSSLSAALARSQQFPDLCLRLVAAGEQTGQLELMLARIADIFEKNFHTQLQRLTTLLAPLLTIMIGVVVGGMMVMVISAILSVNELAVQ